MKKRDLIRLEIMIKQYKSDISQNFIFGKASEIREDYENYSDYNDYSDYSNYSDANE